VKGSAVLGAMDNIDRIYLFDVVHGADRFKEDLASLGFDCETIDVYRGDGKQDLSKKDLVVAPVHLSRDNAYLKNALKSGCKIINHHQMLNYVVKSKDYLKDAVKIEITGTIGKTSTLFVLSSILESSNPDYKILLHTSIGTFYIWKNNMTQVGKLSIAPASVLPIIKQAIYDKFYPNFAIFEISLGFSGIGDINIISSLKEDYKIASNTRWASSVKLKSIQNINDGSTVIIPSDIADNDLMNYSNDLNIIKFCAYQDPYNDADLNLIHDKKSNNNREPDDIINLDKKDEGIVFIKDNEAKNIDDGRVIAYNNIKTVQETKFGMLDTPKSDTNLSRSGSIGLSFISLLPIQEEFYIQPLLSSISAALSLNVDDTDIKDFLANFSGVKDRMELKKINGIYLLNNSNSGVRLSHLDKLLKDRSLFVNPLTNNKRRLVLIIGEENRYICNGLDKNGLYRILNDYKDCFDRIFIIKDKDYDNDHEKDLFSGYTLFETVDDGIKYALSILNKEDMIISFVKRWG